MACSALEFYNDKFLEAKERLNAKQLEAVEKIFGPVMTVAGPGTGKTQLLAIRIGNIIQNAAVDPHNILCLTFTDAAAMEMRERLKRFIGPEAYNVGIFTFHSFCNYVIQDNLEYFGGIRNLQLISDLELVDVFHNIIDSFGEDHPLYRFSTNIYYERNRLKNLINQLKKEGWSYAYLKERVDHLEGYYKEKDENGEYKRKDYVAGRKTTDKKTGEVYQKGEFKQVYFERDIQKFDQLLAAAKELETYDRLLAEMDRFDYNDMILWVIRAFENNPELLSQYQEKYQFILVDEYQDTNGTQNKLLFQLADNVVDEEPNLFIVGDDDQSIFRFQGANMNNILDFSDRYAPKEIVLENNYRSSQNILDRSKQLISKNLDRLVVQRSHLTKELVESREGGESVEPRVLNFSNTSQEDVGVINAIKKLRTEGVDLSEVAVIYRNHKDVDNIVRYFSHAAVPFNTRKKENALRHIVVEQLLNVLSYISLEYEQLHSGEDKLFELLHYSYFGLSSYEIGKLSIYCSRRSDDVYDDFRWRTVLKDEKRLRVAGIDKPADFLRIGEVLEGWIDGIENYTSQMLFERILAESGALESILKGSNTTYEIQVLNGFFNFIKEQSAAKQNLKLNEVVELIDKMNEAGVTIPVYKNIKDEKGVNFVTAHSSKGLEFKYVFIIRADSKTWLKRGSSQHQYALPPNIQTDGGSTEEDERRLFYVAMTRAKDFLTISYANSTDDDKSLGPVKFISEIAEEDEVEFEKVDAKDLVDYQAALMTYDFKQVPLIDPSLIDKVLENFKLSATSLSKYLRCPITFYFENILRVPKARSANMGYGNAVHYALERFFLDLMGSPAMKHPAKEKLLEYFEIGMKRFHSHFSKNQYEKSVVRGKTRLGEYFDEYHNSWDLPRGYKLEHDIKTEVVGVPISGKIDRISIFDDHIEVVDYKTGRYKAANLKPYLNEDEPGGDYWRQIVFYRLLIDNDSFTRLPMRQGVMDFVEKDEKADKFQRKVVTVDQEDMENLKKQLQTTYEAIKQHKFNEGCEDEKCNWCSFVKKNVALKYGENSENQYEDDSTEDEGLFAV